MKVLRVPLFTRMRAMGTAPGRAVRLGEPRAVRVCDLLLTPSGPVMMMKQQGRYFYVPFEETELRAGEAPQRGPSPARETEA